jgi:hypothetical protein
VDVLRFYRDFTQSAPEELTAYVALLHTPDGIPAVAVIACYCGDVNEGEKVFKPLRAFSSPMVDVIQPMPFPREFSPSHKRNKIIARKIGSFIGAAQ